MMFRIATLPLLAALVSAQEPINLKINLGDVSINKIPFVLAYREGIYRKNGLNVDQFISPGAARAVRHSGVRVPTKYIRDEQAPVSAGGGTPLMVSRTTQAGSLDRIILATTDRVVRWHVIARPGIENLQQLKGKRLGFTGAGAMTHMAWLAICRELGWDPLRDVSLMAGGDGLETLDSKAVDAFIAGEVPYAMAVRAGHHPLVDLRKFNIPIAGSGIATTRTWVSNNREAARRVVKSLVEGIALMKRDKNRAFRAMEDWYGITDPKAQEIIYAAAGEMPRKPYPHVPGIQETMKLYDSHEMRKLRPEDFYDDSFVRELDQSGFIDSLYPAAIK